jgi:hypothetical protein
MDTYDSPSQTDLGIREHSDITVSNKQGLNAIPVSQEYPAKSTTSLNTIIHQFGSFPAYSIVIGVCEDGLPLVLDLSSPRPGSILVYRNSDKETTEILNSICLSAVRINPPDDIAVCVIAEDPDAYLDLIGYPHTQAMLAPYEKSAGNLVLELSAVAEQRRYGRERGQAFLLVIDDLYSFLSYNTDYGVFVNLKWLVNYGPRSMVWPLIAVRDSNISKFNHSLFSLFPFRISSTSLIAPISNTNSDRYTDVRNRKTLIARIGSKNLTFYSLSI